MKVYALKTHEPIATATWATDEPPTLYATREVAEVAAKEYDETFHDEEPATVVEIEVLGGEPDSVVNTLGPNSTITVDLEQVRNAADANEAFEVTSLSKVEPAGIPSAPNSFSICINSLCRFRNGRIFFANSV